MKYKVTVVRETPVKEGDRYPEKETIYEQTVENLDIQAVISAVNKPTLIEQLLGDKAAGATLGNCTCNQMPNGKHCPIHTRFVDRP